LSVISVAELYAGIREGKERNLLEVFLQSFTIILVDQSIAQSGGLYRRDYGKSHGVGLADAIIAATSDSQHAKLVTLNAKYFPMLNNVHVPYSKS
jgi:predicted nucleic acid-binding protein